MAITAATSIRWTRDRLGYEPGNTPDQLEFLNFVGRHMVGARPWKWLTRIADLGTTSGQDYLTLPTDFGSLLYVQFKSELVEQVEPTSMPTLMDYERGPGTFDFHVAMVYATVSGVPVPRLRVFPVPDSTDADIFQVYYRAGWADLTAATDTIPIPDWMGPLWRELVTAAALGWNEADVSQMAGAAASGYLAQVWAGPIAKAAIGYDGRVQQRVGRLKNGIVAASSGRFSVYSSTKVQDPT